MTWRSGMLHASPLRKPYAGDQSLDQQPWLWPVLRCHLGHPGRRSPHERPPPLIRDPWILAGREGASSASSSSSRSPASPVACLAGGPCTAPLGADDLPGEDCRWYIRSLARLPSGGGSYKLPETSMTGGEVVRRIQGD